MPTFILDDFENLVKTSEWHFGATIDLGNGVTRCPIILTGEQEQPYGHDLISIPERKLEGWLLNEATKSKRLSSGIVRAKVNRNHLSSMLDYLTRNINRRDALLLQPKIEWTKGSAANLDFEVSSTTTVRFGPPYLTYNFLRCYGDVTLTPMMQRGPDDGEGCIVFVATKIIFRV